MRYPQVCAAASFVLCSTHSVMHEMMKDGSFCQGAPVQPVKMRWIIASAKGFRTAVIMIVVASIQGCVWWAGLDPEHTPCGHPQAPQHKHLPHPAPQVKSLRFLSVQYLARETTSLSVFRIVMSVVHLNHTRHACRCL